MNSKRLLIINGSPRKKGTSYSFARTIKMLAEDTGNYAEIIHIIEYFDGEKNFEDLKSKFLQSDIISVVAPLYVDTLPYLDIWFFEKLSSEFKSELDKKDFFAIGQCGFPDITRCEPLLESCRCFADEVGMNWLGGLGYGGGAILEGALLENLGRKGKKITGAFKLALEDVFQNQNISNRAQELLTIKIPKILYRPLAALLNYNSRKTARKYGVTDLTKKVYLEE